MKYNVCFATDNNYSQHLAVALTSLFVNNKNINELEVYVLSNKISHQNINKLKKIEERFERIIKFINVDNIEALIGITVNVNALSISTYLRLFLTKLLPESVNTVLYLDCDIIVDSNIDLIWDCDIDNNYVAGVMDTMYPEYFEGIGLPINKCYINAGVLLINLKKWRDVNITLKFIQFINKFKGNVPHLDQGVINGVLQDKLILDLKYNVQTPLFIFKKYKYLIDFFKLNNYYTEKNWNYAKEFPTIIHYSSSYAGRPWFKYSFHPKKSLYRYYKKISPYSENKLQNENVSIIRKIKYFLMINFQSVYLILKKINEE